MLKIKNYKQEKMARIMLKQIKMEITLVLKKAVDIPLLS
jgi:hypothetical protein